MHAFFGRAGEGEFPTGRILQGENFTWRGKFPRYKRYRRKFYAEGICQNFYTKFLYVGWFLFTDSILCVEMLRVIVLGKFSPGLIFPEDISVGRGIQIFRRYLKNDQKFKKKQVFLTEIKEQH